MKKIIIGVIACILFISNVYAHPGRTSNGCHNCNADNTDCSKWGLEDNEYHCHNGGTYTNNKGQTFNSDGTEIIESNNNNGSNESNNDSSSSINSNTSNQTENNNSSTNTNSNSSSSSNTTEDKKSGDNTLKIITIDGKSYNNIENIVHVTSNETVNMVVVTNNDKATYEIKNIEPLVDGDNNISIVVTAENGAIKTYNIIVTKEKILSSETGIEVIINDEKIVFEDYEALLNVDSSITKLNIDYKLKDEKAKAEMDEIEELVSGDNVLIIKVIAEDGSQQDYKITIYKSSIVEDIIYTIIGLAVIGGIGYGIYQITKKRN